MDECTVIFGVGSVILTILLVGGALAGVILAGQAGIRARFDDLRTEMSGRIDDLRTEMSGRFDDVNRRFDDVNSRFDNVNRRIDGVESRLSGIEARLRSVKIGVAELRGYVLHRNDLFPEPGTAAGKD